MEGQTSQRPGSHRGVGLSQMSHISLSPPPAARSVGSDDDETHRPGLTSGSRELRRLNVAMLFAALAAFGLLYSTQALLPAIGADFGVGPDGREPHGVGRDRCPGAGDPAAVVGGRVGRPGAGDAGRTAGRAACSRSSAAAAPLFWVLVLARGLVGVSLAAVVAVAVAHLGDEVHPAELGTAIGVYVAGNTLGGISGRLIPGPGRGEQLLAGGGRPARRRRAARRPGLHPAAPRRPSYVVPGDRRHASTSARCATCSATASVVRLCLLAFLLMGGFVALLQLPDVPARGRAARAVHDRDVAAVPGLPRRHGQLAAGRPALGPLRPSAAGARSGSRCPSQGWP